MESKSIRILENFGLISIVMLYFGPTHKAFLILSSLNTKSRAKLDEYYDEFRRLMSNNSRGVLAYDKQAGLWNLPTDLFRFRAILECEQDVDMFLQFVQRICDKQGCWFNNNK